jgi:hypothetical protein
MKNFWKYCAVMLLSVFSLIAIGEITHHHDENDVHCYSTSAHHIHSEVHSCAFCDFTFSTPGAATIYFFAPGVIFFKRIYSFVSFENCPAVFSIHYPLRGPPVV